MAEYERNNKKSDEWYTPPELIAQMGVIFDLDPCSPIYPSGMHHWIPAKTVYTKIDDGLIKDWYGFVFMNPPYGGRNSHLIWLDKFLDNGSGVAIVRAYTSAKWFQDYIPKFDAICFPRGKTKFVKPDGSIGKQPGHGICLLALGDKGIGAIKKIDGLFFRIKHG